MSTGLVAQPLAMSQSNNSFGETEITMPHVGALAEQQRAEAEIKGMISIAKMYPRDESMAIEKIKVACQRPRLAENSQYSYNKGGTDIEGASIDLLTAIANYWGNINFGFRILSQNADSSNVECYAWDMETNVKRVINVEIPHSYKAKGVIKKLNDPRDIYEHVANFAQRRVRKCLENVIPSDVVDVAVDECNETLKIKFTVTPEGIKKMLLGFSKFNVTLEQIEKRLGRKVDSITPAQSIAMNRINKSLCDGMSTPESWFPRLADDSSTNEGPKQSVKEKLKAKQSVPAKAPLSDDELLQQQDYERQMKEASQGNGQLFDSSAEPEQYQ
jgi:hypothetical protein